MTPLLPKSQDWLKNIDLTEIERRALVYELDAPQQNRVACLPTKQGSLS
jgi:hypothetical protein